jgi:hypothetical protein
MTLLTVHVCVAVCVAVCVMIDSTPPRCGDAQLAVRTYVTATTEPASAQLESSLSSSSSLVEPASSAHALLGRATSLACFFGCQRCVERAVCPCPVAAVPLDV